ncbi:MAG TPA: hypothetical protein PK020_16675, partial [Ilumatobacteraceae bacterium]|nr:hypothetical protein [Ilumatobacteraceae bacterium]
QPKNHRTHQPKALTETAGLVTDINEPTTNDVGPVLHTGEPYIVGPYGEAAGRLIAVASNRIARSIRAVAKGSPQD